MADACGLAQGLMDGLNYVNYVNYSSFLLRRCISERNKVSNTLLYEATVLKYNSVPGSPISTTQGLN